MLNICNRYPKSFIVGSMGITMASFMANFIRFKIVKTIAFKPGYKSETISKTLEGVTIQNQTCTIMVINTLSFGLSGYAFLLHARSAPKVAFAMSLVSITSSLAANVGINSVKYKSAQDKWRNDIKVNNEYNTLINDVADKTCDIFYQALDEFNGWKKNNNQAIPLEWPSNQMQVNSDDHDLNAFKYFLSNVISNQQPVDLSLAYTVNIKFIIDYDNKLTCYDLSDSSVRCYANLNQDIVSSINQKNLSVNDSTPDSLKNIALNLKSFVILDAICYTPQNL